MATNTENTKRLDGNHVVFGYCTTQADVDITTWIQLTSRSPTTGEYIYISACRVLSYYTDDEVKAAAGKAMSTPDFEETKIYSA